MTCDIAAPRTSAGSVTTSEPEVSTRNRILTGNTASDGGDGQTCPSSSSSLLVMSIGGGGRTSGGSLQDAAIPANTIGKRAAQAHRLAPPFSCREARSAAIIRDLSTIAHRAATASDADERETQRRE